VVVTGDVIGVKVVTTIVAAVFALKATPSDALKVLDPTNIALDPRMKVH
jgi:hypothetical protein